MSDAALAATPATFLQGRRQRFDEMPAEVIDTISEFVKGVEEISDCRGGVSTSPAAIVYGADCTAFVKARAVDAGPSLADEHRILTQLAAVPHVPRVLHGESIDTEEGEWDLLITSVAPGEPPAHPWNDEDLEAVLDALAEMREGLSSVSTEAAQGNTMVGYFSGWKAIAEDRHHPWFPYAKRWHPLERHLRSELSHAHTVVHGDLRADNILRDARRVTLVDWAQLAVAPPWIDAALVLADVVASRGMTHLPEQVVHPALGGADPELVAATIASFGAFMYSRRTRHVPEHMPWLRPWQEAMADGLAPFVADGGLHG